MRPFLPFQLLTKMDGYKDGVPNLPASASTSLKRLCLYYCNLTDTAQPINRGNMAFFLILFINFVFFDRMQQHLESKDPWA